MSGRDVADYRRGARRIRCGEYVNAVMTTLQERVAWARETMSVTSDDESSSLIAINRRRGALEVRGE